MNTINLIGKITKDIELKKLDGTEDVKYTRFTLAVNRKFTNKDGEREADFISCVAWNKTAEIIAKHFSKGSELGVEGRIQTSSYEKADGQKVYNTDVIVENITFIGKKTEGRPAPEYTGKVESNTEDDENPDINELGEVVISESDLPF